MHHTDSVHRVRKKSPRLIRELSELESLCFPENLIFYTEEFTVEDYYADILDDPENINLMITSSQGNIVGFVCGTPLSQVYDDLKQWDHELLNSDSAIYVDSIHVLPDRDKPFRIIQLLSEFIMEVLAANITRATMHTRRSRGVSRFMQKILPSVKCLRTVENWYGSGESFDYLEVAREDLLTGGNSRILRRYSRLL